MAEFLDDSIWLKNRTSIKVLSMECLQTASQAIAPNGSRSLFRQLSTERRIFSTPWHWCVHGLGLGQETRGFQLESAKDLVNLSHSLSLKADFNYHIFSHHLLQGIVVSCTDEREPSPLSALSSRVHFTNALQALPKEPWQYVRACALLTETLVKIDDIEAYQVDVLWHLRNSLKTVSALPATSDKDRYEKLQLYSNILLAAGQANLHESVMFDSRAGVTYVEQALEVASEISDVFYRGRGSAILFTVLALLGRRSQVCQGDSNPLQVLLESLDVALQVEAQRSTDGVHGGSDYHIFALSLILNAIAVLKCPEYLRYKRDWAATALSLFKTLTPESKVSQLSFLCYALDNLGVVHTYIPDMANLFQQCMQAYLDTTNGAQTGDYLRCTYLIHLAHQLNRPDLLSPKVFEVLIESARQTMGSERYLSSTYNSSYMVAGYVLSALDIADRLELVMGKRYDLAQAIANIKESADMKRIHSPRLAFSLIESALRLRSPKYQDTPLFRQVNLDSSVL